MVDVLDREADALALITPPDADSALKVFAAKDTAAADRIIALVADKIAEFQATKPDVSTEAGRDLIRRFAHRVTKSKTAIEAVGAALAKEQKEVPKRIDATRRHFNDTLERMRDEVRKPLTDWEDAEKKRIERIKADLARLQHPIDDREERTSEALRDWLDDINHAEITEAEYGEYIDAAAEFKEAAIATLTERIAKAEKREAEAAELAKLRAEQAERERKERDERIAREAADRARAEAEQKAKAEQEAAAKREADLKAAAERAEQAKRDAEERAINAAREAKEQAEREAQAAKAREDEDRRKREASVSHRARINGAALEDLKAEGIDEATAKKVVIAIAQGRVRNVAIAY